MAQLTSCLEQNPPLAHQRHVSQLAASWSAQQPQPGGALFEGDAAGSADPACGDADTAADGGGGKSAAAASRLHILQPAQCLSPHVNSLQ